MNPIFTVETRFTASGADSEDGTQHLGCCTQETRQAASLQ
jgi:hypothetical protein